MKLLDIHENKERLGNILADMEALFIMEVNKRVNHAIELGLDGFYMDYTQPNSDVKKFSYVLDEAGYTYENDSSSFSGHRLFLIKFTGA